MWQGRGVSRRVLALAGLLMGLSGCAGTPPDAPEGAQAAESPAGPGPAMVVEAVRVLPRLNPIDVVGHIKPGPCASAAQPCDVGATVQRPGQPGAVHAGLAWTRLGQEFTDPEGLFWRIQLSGGWSSSTPAVDAVELTVATTAAACGGCEPRVAFRHRFGEPAIEVGRTDVFLEPGEDTLLYRVEPSGVGPASMRPADDVRVELRGWSAAYVAAGEPIRLS
jgi:hypothetical protein